MNLWSGYIGLATAFVILATVVMWFFINSRGRIVIKALLIPATVWYGLVLYYTVPNLMGWPTSDSIPDNSHVVAVSVKEPNPRYNETGAIYFWVSTKSETGETSLTSLERLNPKKVFSYESPTDPRAYKLPYSREMHKAIVEAQRRSEEMQGSLMRIKKRGSQGDRSGSMEDSLAALEFEIVNPVVYLPK